eukprot:scaffold1352_cov180-Amphora_coffeaeformis.AAC.14
MYDAHYFVSARPPFRRRTDRKKESQMTLQQFSTAMVCKRFPENFSVDKICCVEKAVADFP